MSFKKVVIFLIILGMIVLPASYADSSTHFKAPSEFENVTEANIDEYGIYNLKNNENVQLCTNKFSNDDYDLYFKAHDDDSYNVSKLNGNITLGKDNLTNDTYVVEVVEHNGEKYIISIIMTNNPSNDTVNNAAKYMKEFNELNNVTPISI